MPWDFRWISKYADYLYLGLMFPSSIAVGTFMGYWADRWLHSDPWGKLIGFLFGVLAGAINFYRDYKRMTRKTNESDKN